MNEPTEIQLKSLDEISHQFGADTVAFICGDQTNALYNIKNQVLIDVRTFNKLVLTDRKNLFNLFLPLMRELGRIESIISIAVVPGDYKKLFLVFSDDFRIYQDLVWHLIYEFKSKILNAPIDTTLLNQDETCRNILPKDAHIFHRRQSNVQP